jgi:hypothetical protein
MYRKCITSNYREHLEPKVILSKSIHVLKTFGVGLPFSFIYLFVFWFLRLGAT